MPEHAPDHPLSESPAAGVAVSATLAPTWKSVTSLAQLPQRIPSGNDSTDPLPEATPTVSVKVCAGGSVAVLVGSICWTVGAARVVVVVAPFEFWKPLTAVVPGGAFACGAVSRGPVHGDTGEGVRISEASLYRW